jgi:hypothetical protein
MTEPIDREANCLDKCVRAIRSARRYRRGTESLGTHDLVRVLVYLAERFGCLNELRSRLRQ